MALNGNDEINEGKRFKMSNVYQTTLLLFLLIFFFTTPAIAQEIFITQKGYIAAFEEQDLDRALDFLAQGDRQAFNRFVSSNPGVFVLRPGLAVYRERYRVFAGKVKIRPKGQTWSMWTIPNAIEKKSE